MDAIVLIMMLWLLFTNKNVSIRIYSLVALESFYILSTLAPSSSIITSQTYRPADITLAPLGNRKEQS